MDGFSTTVTIAKVDSAERLVFGWAMVAVRKDGTVVTDYDGDTITADELEDTAYDFVLASREMGEMHEDDETLGTLVESIVFTHEKIEALGLEPDAVPQGWWVGFHVDDDDAWARVAKGERGMFSVQGRALREAV